MIGVEVGSGERDASVWFGIPLPGKATDPDQSVLRMGTMDFAMNPTRHRPLPPEFAGERMFRDLSTIIGFSRQSRATGVMVWGRLSGTQALAATQEWVVGRFRQAGLEDVQRQPFADQQSAWRPTASQVRLIARRAFGERSQDVLLQSAFASSGQTPHASVTAPLVFVGRGTDAELAGKDIKGKIAVLSVVNGSVVAARELGLPKTLKERGALAVLSAVESPGNLQFVDRRYGCDPAPCFLLGGDDGAFLQSAIGKAAASGKTVEAELTVASEQASGGQSSNVVGVIPGQSAEVILINAHADGYFDGANDNGDGLATLVALADHYGKRKQKPQRTLVFLSSAGHHGPGYGPSAFIRDNPNLLARVKVVVNLEHVAQRDVVQRSRLDPLVDNYASGKWPSSTVERVMTLGVVNATDDVRKLLGAASAKFGIPTYTNTNPSVPGDIGEFARLGLPSVQMISAQIFYHSSGDTALTISKPGLERAALFHAYLIDELSRQSRIGEDRRSQESQERVE